jgi:CBS domain containing-hemolysin-like protein
MFDFFLEHKVQAAAILNEFGGIDGLVTLKRVLSFVFGDITPETAHKLIYTQPAENVFEVAGDMKLTVFEDLTKFGITDPRMTTIGGVMLRALDRLPQVGDQITVEGVVLTVLEMKGHRIKELRASKGSRAAVVKEAQKAAPPEDTGTGDN